MLNSIDDLFYEPIKDLENFRLIKENLSFQDFINLYELKADNEDKIDLLKSLLNIFSHDISQINMCYFNLFNLLLIKTESDNQDNIMDKSNYSYYSNKYNNFITWLIKEYFSESNETIKEYLNNMLLLFIPIIGLNKYDISIAYEQLTKLYFYSEQNLKIGDFLKNLKFLSGLYRLKDNNTKKNLFDIKPYNYFFFKGKEHIQINPIITSIEKSKIHDGISIFFCFNCILNPKYNSIYNKQNSTNKSILFNIFFNNNIKLILSIDSDMNLITKLHDNKSTKDKSLNILKIKENKWYNIAINLSLNKINHKFPLTIKVNNNIINNIKNIDCDNIKITEMNNILICEDFYGYITNFILFTKVIDNEIYNFYQSKFSFGLYKFKHLNTFLEQLNKNFLKYLVILFIPMEYYNNNEINNLANNYINNNLTNNFEIKYLSSENNIVNVKINYHLYKKINLLGGIENILPLFEILLKLSKENNNEININIFQECIQIILDIINIILVNNKTNVKEISKTKFLETFTLFLESFSLPIKDKDKDKEKIKKEIFNTKIMNSIKYLGSYLLKNSEMFPEQCKLYLNNLLFNIKIISKFSLSNQNIIFQFLVENLNSLNLINLIECDNLFSIIGFYNEYYQNYYCCEEHKNFFGENKNKSIIKTPLDSITKIIGYSAKNNDYVYIKMLHLLVIKSKPCLIKYLLENVFISNLTSNDIKNNEKNKFVKYLVKNNILNILLFLLSTYVYPDIISHIINMFSILSVQSNSNDNNNFFYKENIINYIAKSILPIYVRIKNNTETKIGDNNNNLSLRPKTLAASEIVFPKNNNDKNFNLTNVDSSSDEDDLDEYNDIIPNNKNLRKINNEKIKLNYRKKSEDNYQNNKFNLKNIDEFNIDVENNEENNIKKTLEYNSDSEREQNKETEVIRSPRKLKSSVINVLNFNFMNDKNIKTFLHKPSINTMYEKSKIEYKELNPILDKLDQTKLSSFIQTILDSLLNWLKNDFNSYVIKIILAFFKYDKIENIHIYKFIETLDLIINTNIHSKKNNFSKKLFNLDFYLWYIDILFHVHKNNFNDLQEKNNNTPTGSNAQNIVRKGINILVNIIINIKMENKELIELFDDLLLCGTKIKKYYCLNKNSIVYLNNFYLELFISILKEYHKYHSLHNTEQLIIIINICYEYMLYFNNENKSEDIKNFIINDNQIFNGILLSGINTHHTDTPNLPISKFWSDYYLFENIINAIKQLIIVEHIDYKDDKFLEENILSSKKSDTYLERISFLCNCKKGDNSNINNNNNNIFDEDIKNGELPIIYIISNLYIIILNLANNKEEKVNILNNYKLFIIFLVISSSNLSYNPPLTNIIQSRVELILNYFIGFIVERCNNGLDKDILIPCLVEVFILMMKILKKAYDQIQNLKSSTKILNKIMSIASTQKKIDFKQCAVYKIFSQENMSNVFNRNFVTRIKKNNFKDFNDKSYLIQLLVTCLDLKAVKKEVKNIFYADKYIQKGHERIKLINDMKYKDDLNVEENDDCYDLQFFKTRKKLSSIIEDALFALDEEIKIHKEKEYLQKLIYQNYYKKIKKNIFSFNGLWSNKDIFYNKNIEEGDEMDEEENESENSLDIINKDKYKNKYILKYKLINHYGKIPFRPILSPIYDINSYLPCFSLFNKDNLFIEKEEGKNLTTIINLNMDEIFNNENNIFTLINLSKKEEEDDSITSNIYQNIFTNAYLYYKNKIFPNFLTDKLVSSPLSGMVSNSHPCCYVIQMSHIKGYLNLSKSNCSFIQDIYNIDMDEKKLKEDEDYNEEKKLCYGSYLKLNKSKYVYIDIKYKSIKYIFLRRYYYKDSAIEIFTSKNKTYYFNFPDSYKRQCTLNLLLSKFTSKKEIKVHKNKLIGYDVSSSPNKYFITCNTNNSVDFLQNLLDNWKDWNISTLELLLWLNILSNRSFNDISQYPVFPWILVKYKDTFSVEENKTNKKVLSRSFMPNMFKSNFVKKNIGGSFVKSNSSEIKKKQNSNVYNDNKNGIESNTINSIANLNEINENNNYEQFNIDDIENQVIIDKDIRNFSLPMGMMNLTELGEKRKNNYITKYTMSKKEIESGDKENKANNKLYVYGSHYSNPLYVCHYLTRIFPYSNISIELQGDKFDDPNRLLISVSKSFEGASSHEGDLRELLPEFFYLPEIFVNQNNLDLKIKSKKNIDKSNDVVLPYWANNNKYIFISKLKTYLESEGVNKEINKWFDIIFGYKQKGKEAESIYNLFVPSSYDTFDIKKEEPDQKQYYLILTEFGLTPHQITNKKFEKRKAKDNQKKAISESWRERQPKINQFENKKKDNKVNDLKFLKFKFIDDENIVAILNTYQYIKYEIMQFQIFTESNIRFDSNAKNYIKKDNISKLNYYQIRNNELINKSPPIIIYDKGAYIAQGGFLNGKIIVTQLKTKTKSKNINNVESCIINTFEIINPMDTSPVLVLIINKDETTIFSGSQLGSIVIYSNKKETWKKKYQINDHLNMPITSIFFNDNLNIWGSASFDGYVNIYTFPINKKISSIKVDSNCLYADYLFIISSPLPCFIIHCKNYNFYTYSLIGEFIFKENDESEIFSPLIIKESNFGEILMYGNEKGELKMRYLPSLKLFLNKEIDINYMNIDCLEVSQNGRYCTVWNNENNIFYVLYDPSLISESEQLMLIQMVFDLDE